MCVQDGLTSEEMHPYILSILNQYHTHQKIIEDIQKAEKKVAFQMHTSGKTTVSVPQYDKDVLEPYLNWMIYSTALLERSYLEFEKRRTMDRAMLQVIVHLFLLIQLILWLSFIIIFGSRCHVCIISLL
jgi:2,4-dienoyl-CoA reductase-like NADH-dependent reductase (Old Yellow Enzyme family)